MHSMHVFVWQFNMPELCMFLVRMVRAKCCCAKGLIALQAKHKRAHPAPVVRPQVDAGIVDGGNQMVRHEILPSQDGPPGNRVEPVQSITCRV